MVTDLLFEIEFDKFHFEEIHNNPPKGIFKPPKKRRENYSGINLSSNNSVNCNSCFDDELDDLLAKREPDFYDFILSYMHSKHIDTEPELYKKAEVDRKVFAKIRSMRKTNHRPSKPTAIKLCLALELTSQQTQEMLSTLGYGMSNASKVDKSLCSLLSIMTSIFLKSTTKSGRRPNTATSLKTCKMRVLSGRRNKIIQMII